MISTFMAKLKVVGATILVFIVTSFGAYLSGRRAGKTETKLEEQKNDNERLKNTLDIKNEITESVCSRDDGAVHDDLASKWMRD